MPTCEAPPPPDGRDEAGPALRLLRCGSAAGNRSQVAKTVQNSDRQQGRAAVAEEALVLPAVTPHAPWQAGGTALREGLKRRGQTEAKTELTQPERCGRELPRRCGGPPLELRDRGVSYASLRPMTPEDNNSLGGYLGWPRTLSLDP